MLHYNSVAVVIVVMDLKINEIKRVNLSTEQHFI